jgi:heat shock protein HtpX
VEELSIAANIPIPKLYVIEDDAANILATARDAKRSSLVVTTGLLKLLDREELQGVVAHELAHIRTLDTRFKLAVVVLVHGLPFVWDAIRTPLDPQLPRPAQLVVRMGLLLVGLVALLLAPFAPFFALAIRRAIGNQREYLADATSVELTRNPSGIERALAKLAADRHVLRWANRSTRDLYFVDPFRPRGASGGRSSHPAIDDRIRRLRRLHTSSATAVAPP